jgi:hypothetical protein
MTMKQSVPKRRHIKFRRRVISQKRKIQYSECGGSLRGRIVFCLVKHSFRFVCSVHCVLCSLCAVFTVCSVHCVQCSLCAVFTVCCVHCVLCSLCAVFTVCSVHCVQSCCSILTYLPNHFLFKCTPQGPSRHFCSDRHSVAFGSSSCVQGFGFECLLEDRLTCLRAVEVSLNVP